MSPLEQFCDAIIVIGLKRRIDRRELFSSEMSKIGVSRYQWFEGFDKPANSGNRGCTESHRAVLDTICFHGWKNVCVFEDDAAVRPEFLTGDSFNKELRASLDAIPHDARLIYLGGGYASNPKRRVSSRVIEVDRMLTTSSYIITQGMAREMAPFISGHGPIDNLFGGFSQSGRCYCIQPRLFVQRKSMSDLTDQEADYSGSMCDSRHEEMLLDGVVEQRGNEIVLHGHLQRRELAAPNDANGEEVIVDGGTYRIQRIELPQHPPSWYRGEPVTYVLCKI